LALEQRLLHLIVAPAYDRQFHERIAVPANQLGDGLLEQIVLPKGGASHNVAGKLLPGFEVSERSEEPLC
jgi:hypothetical protein